jgi:hypothetical protein
MRQVTAPQTAAAMAFGPEAHVTLADQASLAQHFEVAALGGLAGKWLAAVNSNW